MTRSLLLIIVVAAGMALFAGCGGDDDKAGTSYPAAGEDRFERTTATVQIEVTPQGASAGATRLQELETVELAGPAVITRSDPTRDGDIYVVTTEITEMELTGTSSFGDVTVRESADKQSTGEVRQQKAGEDAPADSFFDVFVEVELPDLDMTLHNEEPMHMAAELSDLPPGEGDGYRGEDDRPLYTPAGLQVGRIVDALHIPNPPAATEEAGATATEEATAEATEPGATATEPSGGDQVEATQTIGCEHTQPGVQSELLDLILLIFVGAEPVEGATVRATAFGDGVIEASAEGVTDCPGAGAPEVADQPLRGQDRTDRRSHRAGRQPARALAREPDRGELHGRADLYQAAGLLNPRLRSNQRAARESHGPLCHCAHPSPDNRVRD